MPLKDHRPTTASQTGPPCGIATLLDLLDDTDQAELQSWLAAPLHEVRHTEIAHSLRAAGYRVSPQMVSWHRRGECKCP